MLGTLLLIVFVILGAGVLYWLVGAATFIAEPFKAVAKWVILAAAVVWAMVMLYRLLQGVG